MVDVNCYDIGFCLHVKLSPSEDKFSFRILRDRALYKVTSDFVDAAISGAVGVISRCIPPINPTDPECFHMLVDLIFREFISFYFLLNVLLRVSCLQSLC